MIRTLALICALVSFPALCFGAEMRPEEIVAKSWLLYRQVKTEKEGVMVSIHYRTGRKETKELTRWIGYDKNGADKIAIRFTKPAMDEGLALLIWRHPGRSDDVWLKLPSFGQERRISVTDQGKYFADTDFTYEDTRQLIGERVNDFTYRLVERKGNNWIIEAIPKGGTESCYGKRIFWIDDAFTFVRIDYYGKNNTLVKTQKNGQITRAKDGRWRADFVEVENILVKRTTTMTINDRKIDTAIAPDTFTKKFLTSRR